MIYSTATVPVNPDGETFETAFVEVVARDRFLRRDDARAPVIRRCLIGKQWRKRFDANRVLSRLLSLARR